ncbi:hypothetical protein FKG94_24340 [Exilibacterium tricleocarpae]|uniref:Uncharacterized protein n=1 Tax=Exilibacterium tricleocarpae TaxID=2591008 RepID=A0A545SSV6_9GAMM|nr:hypothetical protein [Exilibacterium tricleocarpae]TQV68058.1 hypothetical protein FKG94_24340 [Exilibacterium tricleocarpae]
MISTHAARLWLLASVFYAPWSLAQNQCAEQARSRYEEIFCEVKAKGAGGSLPRLEDFRRNDARVQALLLRRPAAKLGIKLPQPKKPAKPKRVAAKPTAPAKSATGEKKTSTTAPKQVASPRRPERKREPADASLAATCRLQRTVIVCGKTRYELALNRQNSELAKGVLSEQNQMGLKPYRGKPGDRGALVQHLSGSYRRYIEKMLEIGLGGATMSFTKFFYTHETLSQQGEDFAARFETMFSFLKKDKAGMSIKAKYNDRLPEEIKQCNPLTDRLIVCAAGEDNWVYMKSSHR